MIPETGRQQPTGAAPNARHPLAQTSSNTSSTESQQQQQQQQQQQPNESVCPPLDDSNSTSVCWGWDHDARSHEVRIDEATNAVNVRFNSIQFNTI